MYYPLANLHITGPPPPPQKKPYYFWQLIDFWIVWYAVSALFQHYNGGLAVAYVNMFVFKMKNKNNESHSGPTPPF